MRLFIAIQFNDEIIEALNELQEDLRDQGMEGHYSPSENLHLTLAFIGEYGDPDEVMDALEESGFRPLSIMLEGVGNFGDTFCAVGNDTGWIQNERQELREYLSVLSYTLTSSFIDDDKSGFRRESKWI